MDALILGLLIMIPIGLIALAIIDEAVRIAVVFALSFIGLAWTIGILVKFLTT